MIETYETALKAVLVHEGGFVDDPQDPGGPTNKGVTQRVYDGFRTRRSLHRRSVQNITEVELGDIYRQQYWAASSCDSMPAGLDYALFDGAVNSGPVQAVKWLQRALKMSMVDGQAGAATIAAANAHPDHDELIADMLALRLAFLKRLKTWARFGKGWGRRLLDVRVRAQALASGSVGSAPIALLDAGAKGRVSDAKPRPGTGLPDAALGGGVVSGGAGAVIKEVQATLEPLAGTSEWIGTVVAVLALTSAALVIGGLVWKLVQSRRGKQYAEALA